MKKAFSPKVLELKQLRYHVKTTHERCGPFSLVVLSQRRGGVTTSSGPTLSETLSSLFRTKLSQNYSTLTQVRSRTKESKLTLHAVVVFWLKQTKQRKHRVDTPSIPSRERELHLENLNFTIVVNIPWTSSDLIPECRWDTVSLVLSGAAYRSLWWQMLSLFPGVVLLHCPSHQVVYRCQC